MVLQVGHAGQLAIARSDRCGIGRRDRRRCGRGDRQRVPLVNPHAAEGVARRAGRVRPSAKVSVGTPVRVAGRDAYTLELTPVSSSTLVGRIEVAVDASTRAPLRVEVFPKGSGRAAIEAGFTRVSFARIDPQMFSFSPPPGASVKQAAGPPGGKGLVSGSSAPAAPSFPD